MIDVDKIRGATIQYKGKDSTCFTNVQRYRIGFDVDAESLFTIDDEGDYHSLTPDYIEQAFDVDDYIKKPSMVGKYVRYIQHSSDFMRHGDIGIVVRDNNGGVAYDVHWLNPIEPHTDGNHTWFVLASSVEPL